ncbi:MAG: hypothetical protein GXO86_07035 [Chlorobi bacterium]|nr:hypothetical protein [Chlorobiota bacterium]
MKQFSPAKKLSFEDKLVIFFLILYTGLNILWGFVSHATWDDDCPSRYYATLNAFNEPVNFISLWNRPLFALIFSLPVHIGRNAVTVLMVFISAVSSWYLYLGVKETKQANAYLVVPFLLFQTYFFSISRNAETEPLASALINFGYYFLVKKKWLWFSLMASLIPLARLELSVLLVFWVWYLMINKQYKYIPLMVVPFILWNIAGGLIEGDFLYVFTHTIGTGSSVNRYGHSDFWFYFHRYIFVISPIVFYFFFIGFLQRMVRRKMDAFVFWQFVTGFLLYVLFSWKLNMGNAAGFLRNLIPLSSFVAILALEGFNLQNDVLLSVFAAKQKKKIKRKKSNSYLLTASVVALIIITALFFSYKLFFHHWISTVNDFTNLWILSLMILLTVVVYFMFIRYIRQPKSVTMIFGLIMSFGMLSYTLISEPPDANMNGERTAMKRVSDIYMHGYLKEFPVYVNHIWFFWANDLDKFSDNFHKVTKENLQKAVTGSICIWESHYSAKHDGDVQPEYFLSHPEWLKLTIIVDSTTQFTCEIYQKSKKDGRNRESMYNRFVSYQDTLSTAYIFRGNYFLNEVKEPQKAISDYNKSLQIDSTGATAFLGYLNRGVAYQNTGNFARALTDTRKCIILNSASKEGWNNYGFYIGYFGDIDSAIICYTKAIQLDEKFILPYLNRAAAYMSKKQPDSANADLTKILTIAPNNINARAKRIELFLGQQKWEPALDDINEYLKYENNGLAWLLKGNCEYNLNKKSEACQSWKEALMLGNKEAEEQLKRYCLE